MTYERALDDIASQDERCRDVILGIMQHGWDFRDQVDYWGIRIADAVVVGRTSLEKVSEQLNQASLLHSEASQLCDGRPSNFGQEDDFAEALARWTAYACLRNGKNRVRTANHRRRHLADYQARVAMLRSATNTGLGRLEARDLHLDDLWYDREES